MEEPASIVPIQKLREVPRRGLDGTQSSHIVFDALSSSQPVNTGRFSLGIENTSKDASGLIQNMSNTGKIELRSYDSQRRASMR